MCTEPIVFYLSINSLEEKVKPHVRQFADEMNPSHEMWGLTAKERPYGNKHMMKCNVDKYEARYWPS